MVKQESPGLTYDVFAFVDGRLVKITCKTVKEALYLINNLITESEWDAD